MSTSSRTRPDDSATPAAHSSSLFATAVHVSALVIGLWFVGQACDLGVNRFYNADEFRYAHAAWLVSQGQTPSLDFWDPKFPFLYQVLSVAFLGATEDPTRVQFMRWGMLAFFAVTCWAGWQMTRHELKRWACLSPIFMLSCWTLTFVAAEIQPDGLATAFFFSALAVLTIRRLPAWARGLGAGALLGLSLWTSQKVLCHGTAFAIAFAIDVVHNRRRGHRYLVGHPLGFALGFIAVVATVVAYLAASGSLAACYDLCIRSLVVAHHDIFPERSHWLTFRLLLRDGWVLLLLALVGLGSAIAVVRKKRTQALSDPNVVLVLTLGFTFLTWYLQRGPYLYSLLPFMAIMCVFAARGARAAWGELTALRESEGRRWKLATVGTLTLANLHLVASLARAGMVDVPDNEYQYRVLNEIASLTDPRDPVYDNSGSYVARPHAFDPYFTNLLMRSKTMRDRLPSQVPAAILRTGCTVFVVDARVKGLPERLTSWLDENFRPVTSDIRLWGRHFRLSGDGQERAEFQAIRDAHYTVRPQAVLDAGSVIIDGSAVARKGFRLTAGSHEVRFAGAHPAAFDIVWAPSERGIPETIANLPRGPLRRFSYIHYFEGVPILFLP